MTFDVLEYVQDLESVRVASKQAKVQASALHKICGIRLVTREYLCRKMQNVDVCLSELEAKMRKLTYLLAIKLGSIRVGPVAVISMLLTILK